MSNEIPTSARVLPHHRTETAGTMDVTAWMEWFLGVPASIEVHNGALRCDRQCALLESARLP